MFYYVLELQWQVWQMWENTSWHIDRSL